MKRITAVLVLLAIAAGCAGTKRRAIVPGPHPTEEQEYREGFPARPSAGTQISSHEGTKPQRKDRIQGLLTS